jgi:hypothetical protein
MGNKHYSPLLGIDNVHSALQYLMPIALVACIFFCPNASLSIELERDAPVLSTLNAPLTKVA